MSAVNPLPQTDPAERRAHEPSMEEILASIRRIIADDQSLPGRVSFREPDPAPAQPAMEPIDPASTATAPAPRHEPVPPNAATAVPAAAAPLDIGAAHGPISAPQFAMPHGPAGDAPMPAAETRAVEAEPDTRAPEPTSATQVLHVEPEVAAPDEDVPPRHAEPIDPTPGFAPVERIADPEVAVSAPPAQEAAPLFSNATSSAVSDAFNMLAASRLADNSDELMTLAREMIRPLLRTWIDDNLPSMVERLVRAEIERVARGGR